MATTVTSVVTNQRVEFPNVHARPEQQTLGAIVRRNVVLLLLYAVWVLGCTGYFALSAFSVAALAYAAIMGDASYVPSVVRIYIGGMVLYSSYHLTVHRNGQPKWPYLHELCCSTLRKYPYFRHQICIFEEFEEESLKNPDKAFAKPKDKAIYAFHPHGILGCGCTVNGAFSMRFDQADAPWLVAENLFWFPLMRDLFNWMGFDNVRKETFVKYMKEDRNLCFIPGGFEEATIYQHGKHRSYIKRRFGFIKLALEYGYKIHPVYTFGEELAYNTFTPLLKFRLWLNTWKIPGAVFSGRLWCPYLPRNDCEITTVVGKAVQMPKIENPTKEDVVKYQAIYVKALVDLFELNKVKYGADPTAQLEFF
ncbi:hypothetical protein Poli38472_008287 [Pythium oligandrum]|uniref:Acyltransferase n=1 Tax=Pythium oligandrum TaxID=41045 RepID=A0A8K1CN46_PYTOL|nr:hypothetical protein Poli38472_008287 [Pythium oligandrum]|eukprot:TMW65645.1 hypothetical protein Poli38472_008287 [Pythium oligandrum]